MVCDMDNKYFYSWELYYIVGILLVFGLDLEIGGVRGEMFVIGFYEWL